MHNNNKTPVTNEVIARLDAGYDHRKLRGELARRHFEVMRDAGLDLIQDVGKDLSAVGKWNMDLLAANTQSAIKRDELTPVQKLRDCEIAQVHARYADIDHPQAQAALRAAQNGRDTRGALLPSAQMEARLNAYLTQKAQTAKSGQNGLVASGGHVIGRLQLRPGI